MKLFIDYPIFTCLALFLSLCGFIELGRQIGILRYTRAPNDAHWGNAAIEGSLLALFGLLVAFTFSGAASRFDHRRELIVSESNAIGTAYLRIDLASAASQQALRDAFRRYVDSRVAAYDGVKDLDSFKAAYGRSATIQHEIWNLAITAGAEENAQSATNMLLLPAINELIDIAALRTATVQMHPPLIIFLMLLFLAHVSAILAGHGMMASRSRNDIHAVSFAAIMAAAIYVIIDLEYPRLGFVGLGGFDQLIKNALQ